MDPIPHLGNPSDQSLKEYIVTLKSMKDADDFYKDMEEPGGSLYIPKRKVECKNRRPISRNTHYLLTYDEAAEIRNDPRVLEVELNPTDRGLVRGTFGFLQTSEFSKTTASDSQDINWGFLRCLSKNNISTWGINDDVAVTATILSDCTGKNVDVVIMDDGCPVPTTYEYAQNPDGTGYSRMVEYNWEQHNPEVFGLPVGNYLYSANRLQEHGAHTTGTTAGNTQGWARDANIYNLTYYDSIDFVREFHKNKPVNPLTGVKNPTVMNNSWGYRMGSVNPAFLSKLTIRGINYFPTSGSYGSYVWDSNVLQNIARLNIGGAFPARDAATDADMIDAMLEGVIIVASAGNSYFYVDELGGLDYNNTMIYGGQSYYIHRGSSPGSADGGTEETKIICSGALGQHNDVGGALYNATGIETGDYKAEFSNYGPRIDCFAPGSAIQSIWASYDALYDSVPAPDPRLALLGETDAVNNNFKKCPGTSMSGPQTTGVLACLAEKYPRMTQAEARAYIDTMCPPVLESTNGGAQDTKDAGLSFNPNSSNRILLLTGTRVPTADVGGYHPVAFPEISAAHRPLEGQVVPRRRSLYRGNPKSTFQISSDVSNANQGDTFVVSVDTTNIANGTKIGYIVTAKPQLISAWLDGGFSGICNFDTVIPGTEGFDTRPNKGNRIKTTSINQGEYDSITNSVVPASGALTVSTTPTTGSEDDGYWDLSIPFNISFAGSTYNRIYVGTNSYITFLFGTNQYADLGPDEPATPKIMISANDNSCQRIYYGALGVAPNRIFVVRWEGHSGFSGGVLGSPTMVWSATFYENNPNQIDIHTGVNARQTFAPSGYNFNLGDLSIPNTGSVIIQNNHADFAVNVNTNESMIVNVRLDMFPAPNVNINVN